MPPPTPEGGGPRSGPFGGCGRKGYRSGGSVVGIPNVGYPFRILSEFRARDTWPIFTFPADDVETLQDAVADFPEGLLRLAINEVTSTRLVSGNLCSVTRSTPTTRTGRRSKYMRNRLLYNTRNRLNPVAELSEGELLQLVREVGCLQHRETEKELSNDPADLPGLVRAGLVIQDEEEEED